MNINICLSLDAPRGWKRRALLYVATPLALVTAASAVAYAYDTSWIQDKQPVSASALKADLDEIQTRIATLETNPSGAGLTLFPTPLIHEFSFTGEQTLEITLPAGVDATMKAILADIFVTASIDDQQNFHIGNGCTSGQKSWVDTPGQQPSVAFGALNRQCLLLTYPGEQDGFTSYYGMWYSGTAVPLKPNARLDFNNHSNSGSNGWVYMVILGYFK